MEGHFRQYSCVMNLCALTNIDNQDGPSLRGTASDQNLKNELLLCKHAPNNGQMMKIDASQILRQNWPELKRITLFAP